MKNRIQQLIPILGCVCVLSFSAVVNAQEFDPQFVDTEITDTESSNLALEKYKFMTNAKEKANEEYKIAVETEIQNTLALFNSTSAAYELDVERIRKRIVELKAEEEKQNEEEIDESFENLVLALNSLQETVAGAVIVKNDIPTVTSEYATVGSEPLIECDRIDSTYTGSTIEITGENRDNLERLVMGEAGNQGFIGAALVAQAIHDDMLVSNCYDVLTIKQTFYYSGVLTIEPNDDVKQAVAFIFDKGGIAVKHRIMYYYAPALVSSDFHESQMYIVTYKEHKFFDRWD